MSPLPVRPPIASTKPPVGESLAWDDSRAGVTLTGHGRIALLSCDCVRDLHFAILDVYADTAQDVLYRSGFEWALQTMIARYTAPAAAEPLPDPATQVEAWWSVFRATGWGSLRPAEPIGPGIVHLELLRSAVAESLGRADDPVCHLYAGLFAGAFSFLDRSERHAVEIQCRATGAETCRFVIGPAADIDRTETWRQQGVSADDIVARLASSAGTPPAAEAPAASVPVPGTAGAAILKDTRGRRVVGGSAEMLRSLRFVFGQERTGSWATVLKAIGRSGGRKLASERDAEFARDGRSALVSQPLPAAMQPLESWFAEYGWGRLTIDPSGAEEYGLVVGTLAQSCFAELLGDGADLADALPAGMLQGYFEHVTGQMLAAEEIACARQGPGPCTFAVSTPERLALILPFIGRESASQLIARLRA